MSVRGGGGSLKSVDAAGVGHVADVVVVVEGDETLAGTQRGIVVLEVYLGGGSGERKRGADFAAAVQGGVDLLGGVEGRLLQGGFELLGVEGRVAGAAYAI